MADDQVGRLVEAIELGTDWLEEVLAIVSLKDEVQQVSQQRRETMEKLRRLARAYVDGLYPNEEYHRQRRILEMELELLIVPEANAAEEAGKLIKEPPRLWIGATLDERRKLLVTMLDAVYVDTKETRSIVAVKPKPPFRPIFQVAATREGSGVDIIKGPPDGLEARCCWWRRGRVELPLKQQMIVRVVSAWRTRDTTGTLSLLSQSEKVES